MFEPGGRYGGRWIRTAGAFPSTSEHLPAWTEDEIPNGISYANGQWTTAVPAKWRLTANVLGPNASATLTARIGTATDTWARDTRTAATSTSFTIVAELALPTGSVFGVYVTAGALTAPSTTAPLTAQSFNFTATYVGPM
jgi:opacity protein-like surface antigen